MNYVLTINPKTCEATLAYDRVVLDGGIDVDLDGKNMSFVFKSSTKRPGNKGYLANVLTAVAPALKRGNSTLDVSAGRVEFCIDEEYDWDDANKKVIRDAIRAMRDEKFKELYVKTRMKEFRNKYRSQITVARIKEAICEKYIDGDTAIKFTLDLGEDLSVIVSYSLKYKKYIVDKKGSNSWNYSRIATTTNFDKLIKIVDGLSVKSFLNLPLKNKRRVRNENGELVHEDEEESSEVPF